MKCDVLFMHLNVRQRDERAREGGAEPDHAEASARVGVTMGESLAGRLGLTVMFCCLPSLIFRGLHS